MAHGCRVSCSRSESAPRSVPRPARTGATHQTGPLDHVCGTRSRHVRWAHRAAVDRPRAGSRFALLGRPREVGPDLRRHFGGQRLMRKHEPLAASLDNGSKRPARKGRALWLLWLVLAAWLSLASTSTAAPTAQPVVTGLQRPTMFTFAPDGRIFYTETNTGRLGVFTPANGSTATYFQVTDLCPFDQGLSGVALHPDFPRTETVYAYATRRTADGSCHNQVLRIRPIRKGRLGMDVLLSDPYVGAHVGGRLLFGPRWTPLRLDRRWVIRAADACRRPSPARQGPRARQRQGGDPRAWPPPRCAGRQS